MKEYTTSVAPGDLAVDDTILISGVECTAGSKILKGFVPLFSATAVEKAEKAGYKVSGKTNVGEFGLDLLGEFSAYAGGEEKTLLGAAASLIAKGEVTSALQVDLDGAPRRAAALSGTVFIKPTYGTVSRYGIIPCACSGETVGAAAKTVSAAKDLLTVIAGHDGKDGTSLPAEKYGYAPKKALSAMKVGVLKNLTAAASPAAAAKVAAASEALKAAGVSVEETDLPIAGAARTAWRILMAAETCNNVSRYDGVKFGYRSPDYSNIDELYVNTRTEGLNFLTKSVLLYGSDVLSKGRYLTCYDKALRLRRVAVDALGGLFGKYDSLLLPVCSETSYSPYPVEEAFEKTYRESLFTAVPNLTGIPSLVVSGVQLIAPAFGAGDLFALGARLES